MHALEYLRQCPAQSLPEFETTSQLDDLVHIRELLTMDG